MKVKLTIFDLDSGSWFRRPLSCLEINDPKLEISYLYANKNSDINKISVANERLTNLKLKCDVAVIFAYRIPELLLLESNPDVKFIYVQHGYYPNFIYRTLFGVVRKSRRILFYFMMVLQFSLRGGDWSKLLSILNIWIRPNFATEKLRSPNICVIISEDWREFHEKKLGWKKSEYIVKKFHEPKLIERTTVFDYQYIAQTLVEDGRISKTTLINCINSYVREHEVKKLCIITHPRTDSSVYDAVDCEVYFEEKCCYNTKTIGHYSTLLLYLKENNVPVELIHNEELLVPNDFLTRFGAVSGADKRYTNDARETYINREVKRLAL